MARDFDPASSQFLRNATTPPITTYPFTASLWAVTDQPVGGNDFCMWQIQNDDFGSDLDYFRMSIRGPFGGELRLRVAEGPDFPDAFSSIEMTQNQWHHCCGVFASSTSRDVYLDGGNKGSNTEDVTPAGINSMDIGREGDFTSGDHWSGRLAELVFWDVALTEPEIAALASGIHPLRIRPLSIKLYYPLEGIDSPELDRTGSGYNMTLQNGPTRGNHPPVIPYSARFWGQTPFIEAGAPPVLPSLIGGKSLADSRNWSREGRGIAKWNAFNVPIGEKVNYFTPADTGTVLEIDPGPNSSVVVQVEAGTFRCKTGSLGARVFTAEESDDRLTVTGSIYQNGQGPLRVSNSGGALPTGFTSDTDYWVRDVEGDTFRLALTRNGASVDITADGMGTHCIGGDDGAAVIVGFSPAAPVADAAAVAAIGAKKLRLNETQVFDTPVSIVGEAGSGDILAWWTA